MDNVLFGQLGEIRKGKDAGNGKKVMRRFSSYISKKLSKMLSLNNLTIRSCVQMGILNPFLTFLSGN